MPLAFQPDNDFADFADGLETVTFRRRGSSSATVVTAALRRAVAVDEATLHNRYNTRKQVPSGGGHVAADVTWHLPAAALPVAPRPGDRIIDADGRHWTILAARKATLGSRWKCPSRDVAVAHGLDDTISIEKACFVKGDSGAVEPQWRTWHTGVRARIQPAGVEIDAERQARRTTARVQIFVDEDVALDHAHRIRGPDGTVYRVRATLGAERIGEVQTIDAEVIG